jgi:predicted molibdopterin-dependent oxidoreductase YjgC
MRRVEYHPILGSPETPSEITIYVDGKPCTAREGEMLAAALLANNISVFRHTRRFQKPRGIFCGIGRCTDCMMIVDGIPNVRTCVTPARDGMKLETQQGLGAWRAEAET